MEGTDDIVDLIPAPGTVKEEGTFLNVKNLLKDTTAALLGGDSSMVPDEALVALKNLIDGITPSGIGAARVEVGSYTGTGTYGPSFSRTLNFNFTPKVIFIAADTEQSGSADIAMLVYGVRSFHISGMYNPMTASWLNKASWGDKKVTLTTNASGASARAPLNLSGQIYKYTAIG